jgi:hypothetical protein
MIIIVILLVIILILLIVSRVSSRANGIAHQNERNSLNKKAVLSEVNIELTKRKEAAEARAKEASLAKVRRDGILDENTLKKKEVTGPKTTSTSMELAKRKEAAKAIAQAAALTIMKREGILDGPGPKKKEITGQTTTFKEYETLARLIYTIYNSVSRFRPVEREEYDFEEELVLSSRPYLNPNIQYYLDNLNEKDFKTFDDKQTFLKLVECISKLDKVQSKYFNKISSLSSSRYTLSQSQLYELEQSHWNDTKDLFKSFESAFDELFTKIGEDLSYKKILEQKYYENLTDYYYF